MDQKSGVKFEGKTDILQGKWHELKGRVRQQFAKITDDDMARLTGKQEELVGILQMRYGYAKERAEQEINNWLRDLDTKVKAVKPSPR